MINPMRWISTRRTASDDAEGSRDRREEARATCSPAGICKNHTGLQLYRGAIGQTVSLPDAVVSRPLERTGRRLLVLAPDPLVNG